jgi:hypothetical protein
MYYYFLGRTLPWGATDVPPDIADTIDEESNIRNNIIYMKRINPTDISFVVPRHNWIADTVYDRYDENVSITNPSYSGATHIKDAIFYVMTNDMNIYKCIHNNYNQPSTIKPTGTDYEMLYTSDGYIWKYMYSIPPSLQYRFVTNSYIPVIRSLNQRYYDNLGIDTVTIMSGGSGYEGGPVTTAEVIGNGVGATIGLSIDPTNGRIVKVRIKNPGAGYTYGTINIVAVDGRGNGIYGNQEAVLIPRFSGGKLVDVTISDPGANYTSDIQTTIVVSGSGHDAELYPVVENGEIVDVIITNPGYGYSTIFIHVESPTGTGAELLIGSGVGDIESIQADVELLAIPGPVYVVDAITTGKEYSYAKCVVSGDGDGLAVTPIIYNGTIVRYEVTNIGANYTWCNIEIQGDGEGATCKPLLSPRKGHGFNAIDELFASTVSFYSTIKFEENQGMIVNNDYRQFGILKNPENFLNTGLYRELTGSTCYAITVDNAAGFVTDEEFVLKDTPTRKTNVVATDNVRNVLLQEFGGTPLTPGTILKRSSNNDFYDIKSSIPPDINKKSGELIFVDNRYSIFQTSNQYISLRTTIKF